MYRLPAHRIGLSLGLQRIGCRSAKPWRSAVATGASISSREKIVRGSPYVTPRGTSAVESFGSR